MKDGAIGYLVTDWGIPGGGCPDFGVWGLLPGALAGQYAWNVGAEHKDKLFCMTDEIAPVFYQLWCNRNSKKTRKYTLAC